MNKRYVLIATILTVVVVTGYQLGQLENPTQLDATRSPFTALAVEAPPLLHISAQQRSAIASLDVWNLKPLATLGNMPSLKDMFKPFYTLGRDGRFESLQRSDRPAEKWLFQGVLLRAGTMRALFYNPGLRRLKNLGRGDLVDDRLIIRAIGSNSVTLEVTGEKKPQKFDLRIFNANKELYVAKRRKI